MSDEFDFITNASQIQSVTTEDLPFKVVPLKGLKSRKGRTPKVRVYAITAGDYSDYLESTRVYRDGAIVGSDFKDDDLKLLWWCLRDVNHNQIWGSVGEAVAQLRTWPRPVTVALRDAVNEINALLPDEVVEGNSEGGQSDSPPSDSAPTSGSGTSTDS